MTSAPGLKMAANCSFGYATDAPFGSATGNAYLRRRRSAGNAAYLCGSGGQIASAACSQWGQGSVVTVIWGDRLGD